MKILRVIGTMDPKSGGPCQGLRNLIPELTSLGVVNEVVTLDLPGAPFIEKDPFITHALGNALPPWGYNKQLLPWLLENAGNFDVLVIHGLWQYHSHAVRKAISKLKRLKKKVPKVFVMPHGMLDPYFQKAEGRKLKAVRNWFYWKLIESRVVNSANAVLFTCEEELILARSAFRPYKPKAELNIGYGIQPAPPQDTLKSSEAGETFGVMQPYLLYLSRIHEKKGVDLLIEAYINLKKEGYQMPSLVIAGPGLDSAYGRRILTMTGADPQILFPGMLNGAEKWLAFYGCEAFVLPSHQENFGISVVEAMACGKPVLITRQVNIWREIEQGRAGLFSDDTRGGVKALLQQWVMMPGGEKAEMGRRALGTARELFFVKNTARKAKEIFEKQLRS